MPASESDKSASALRVISATVAATTAAACEHAHTALNWVAQHWNQSDRSTEETMPLLPSSSPSSSSSTTQATATAPAAAAGATKIMSPPSVTSREDTAAAVGGSFSADTNRKRSTQGSQYGATHSHDHDHETCELLPMASSSPSPSPRDSQWPNKSSSATSSTTTSSGSTGWRLRLQDLLYLIALVGGATTIALIYPRHYGTDSGAAGANSIGALTTSNHHTVLQDSDDSKDNTRQFLAGGQVQRRAALQELTDELELLRAHQVHKSINGELNTTLRVGVSRFTNGPISFWTRCYESSFPGPLWSVQPGDIINLELVNELEPNVPGKWTPNTYHEPNTTNMHVHGMHVDPTGIADNILRVVRPGETALYQYMIPTNHPRGLYHYHPHFHGSIFIQMAGGMAGPIMVEDDPETLPQEYLHLKQHVLILQEFRFDGGLAADLRKANDAARSLLPIRPEYTSKTLLDASIRALFPQVHTASLETDIPMNKNLLSRLAKHTKRLSARTSPSTNGNKTNKKIKMKTPDISRFYVVNGQYLPKIEVQPRENVLLRFLNAGVSSTLELSLPGCSMRQIANDGIYLTDKQKPRETNLVVLSPGARVDLVVNCEPNSGLLEPLRPLQSVQDESINPFLGGQSDVYKGILAFLHVSGGSREMAIVTTMPPPPDLYAKGDLRDLPQKELVELEPFKFEFSMTSTKTLKDGFPYKEYLINHAAFSMESIRLMPLNQVQEWVVINEREEPSGKNPQGMVTAKNHPFHLHTNAFQIIAMSHGEGVDYQIGDWRDVIAVPTPGNVTIRFRPVDFKGVIVAHCHIAGHSDAGMVARIDIV